MLESRLDDKDKEQYDTLYWSEAAKGWIKRTWVESKRAFFMQRTHRFRGQVRILCITAIRTMCCVGRHMSVFSGGQWSSPPIEEIFGSV